VYYWPAFDRYSGRRDLQRIDNLSQLGDLGSSPQTVWLLVDDDWPVPAVEGYHLELNRPLQGLKLVRLDRTGEPKVE
jgi:hypothetical protein